VFGDSAEKLLPYLGNALVTHSGWEVIFTVGMATGTALSRATVRKMRQNLFWAVGYNTVAFPIAMGLFYPAFGLILRPEIAAISMAGSSFLVAVNALLLKRTKLEGIRRYGAAG